ncbi:DmsC/YnfH family molybdoenzyme membrane anchor subunit [candidate division KSB1 bacterium]
MIILSKLKRSDMQIGFKIDLNKCTGCQACQLACEIENDLGWGNSWRIVETFNEANVPGIPVFYYSVSCNHCEKPVCLKNCPAWAISKNKDSGNVIIDPEKCIGCRYCSWVCPYDAPKYDTKAKVMQKCTFCDHRKENGFKPACVTGCPTGALETVDISDFKKKIEYPGFPEIGIRPVIEIKHLRKNNVFPKLSGEDKDRREKYNGIKTNNDKKVSITQEWPLLIFTLIMSFLTAYLTGSLISDYSIHILSFFPIAVTGLLISTFHLGKPERSVNAIINIKRSWISREILLTNLFFTISLIYLIFHETVIGWTAASLGILTLFSIDKVYKIKTRIAVTKIHSASAILSGLYLIGIFTEQWIIIGWFGFIRLFLYTFRRSFNYKNKKKGRIAVSAIRIIFGFFIPILTMQITSGEYYWYILLSVLVGELIDRWEFYNELDFLTIKKQISGDMKKLIGRKEYGVSGIFPWI